MCIRDSSYPGLLPFLTLARQISISSDYSAFILFFSKSFLTSLIQLDVDFFPHRYLKIWLVNLLSSILYRCPIRYIFLCTLFYFIFISESASGIYDDFNHITVIVNFKSRFTCYGLYPVFAMQF